MPAIIRSIYAYHVKSRGWSDIGYNFLVDRFGRIWEGRYGGIDKPVVGAHTLNYNDYSFAMSAIGNFDTAQPTDVMLRAYGQLFGVEALAARGQPGLDVAADRPHGLPGHQRPPRRRLDGLPGQVPLRPAAADPAVRRRGRAGRARRPADRGVSEPSPQNNLDASPYPDLVVRRAADGRGLVIPTGGLTSFQKRTVVGKKGWDKRADVLVSPDLTGDGAGRPGDRRQVRRGPGAAGHGQRQVRQDHQEAVAARLLAHHRRRRHQRRRPQRPGRPLQGPPDHARSRPAGAASTARPPARATATTARSSAPATSTATAAPTCCCARRTGCSCRPATAPAGSPRRRRSPGPGAATTGSSRGDFNGDGRSDLVARTVQRQRCCCCPDAATARTAPRWAPPPTSSRCAGSPAPSWSAAPGADLIGVAGKQLVVVANRDTFELGAPIDTGVSFAGMDTILNAGDVNRDGFGDVLTRDTAGQLWLFAGNGTGALAAGTVHRRRAGPRSPGSRRSVTSPATACPT